MPKKISVLVVGEVLYNITVHGHGRYSRGWDGSGFRLPVSAVAPAAIGSICCRKNSSSSVCS